MSFKIKVQKEDKLWSKLVRERDGACRKCGKKPPYRLHAHHIMSRVNSATRYDLKNGLTLCVHHHVFGNDSAHKVGKQFVIDIIGQKEYNRLEKLSKTVVKRADAKKIFLAKLNL